MSHAGSREVRLQPQRESGVGPIDEKPRGAPVRSEWPSGVFDGDRLRAAAPGEPTEPPPSSTLPGCRRASDPDDPGVGGGVHRPGVTMSRVGSDLRLAEREVDHVHPVGHRCLDPGGDLGRVAVQADARRRDWSAPCSSQVGAGSDAPREMPRHAGGISCSRFRRRCPLRGCRARLSAWNGFVPLRPAGGRGGTPARRSPSPW